MNTVKLDNSLFDVPKKAPQSEDRLNIFRESFDRFFEGEHTCFKIFRPL